MSAQDEYLSLRSRPARGREPIEVRIPLRDLAKALNEQLPLVGVYKDLPRGRKRPGWKREFTRTLESAAFSPRCGALESAGHSANLLAPAIGEHDLRGLEQIAPPVGPFVPAGAEDPEIANAVLIEQREVFLAILERDVGLASAYVEGHAELVIK